MVKKNGQKIYRGRRVLTPQYLAWEESACLYVKQAMVQAKFKDLITDQVAMKFTFCFANRQAEADVSNLIEGVQDVLVDCGVLEDDRLVHFLIAEKFFGGDVKTIVEVASKEFFINQY